MDISIIIVNYNSLQMLKACIDSVIRYTNDKINFEIIVVDNNSTDGDIKRNFQNNSKIKVIINSENKGFAAANNQGIKVAEGKYILFLNNDTLFVEDSIKEILNFYSCGRQNSIVGCRLLNSDFTPQASIIDKDSIGNSFGENFFLYKIFKKSKMLNRWHYSNKNLDRITEVDIVKGAFIFCPKQIVDQLNGFDENFFFYAEEADFCLRAQSLGCKIYYYPNTKIIHHGGFSTDKNLWFKYKNQSIARIKTFQKHYKGTKLSLLIFFHFMGIFLRIVVYFIRAIFTFNLQFLKKSWYYSRQLFIYPRNVFTK